MTLIVKCETSSFQSLLSSKLGVKLLVIGKPLKPCLRLSLASLDAFDNTSDVLIKIEYRLLVLL